MIKSLGSEGREDKVKTRCLRNCASIPKFCLYCCGVFLVEVVAVAVWSKRSYIWISQFNYFISTLKVEEFNMDIHWLFSEFYSAQGHQVQGQYGMQRERQMESWYSVYWHINFQCLLVDIYNKCQWGLSFYNVSDVLCELQLALFFPVFFFQFLPT